MTGLTSHLQLRRDDFLLDLELAIESGETVAIVGPNGAGKSSTVRALTGLAPLTAGRIELGGRVLDDPAASVFVEPHERSIGTAFQDSLLFPHLNVRRNVGFRISDRNRHDELADDWLTRVGLDGFGDRRVRDLSGGEARRVSIARALIGEPELIILDEPFAGLDVDARAGLRRMLAEQMRHHRSARLLITHDPAEAHTLADRVVVIEQGTATQQGTPEDIRRRPATSYVANLVGVNLLRGQAAQGRVAIDESVLEVAVADRSLTGPVLLTVAPHAVALHGSAPSGSPRNSWPTTVVDLHRLGDVVRVHVEQPVPLVIDVTPGAVEELDIVPGRELWVAIKATSFDPQHG